MAKLIDPTEGAVKLIGAVGRDARLWVLFQWDGSVVARQRILAQPDGELLLQAVEDALDDCVSGPGNWALSCAVAAAPDPYLLAGAFCGDPSAWGIAVVEHRDGGPVLVAKRFLYAMSCGGGIVAPDAPPLPAPRDLDADGSDELLVKLRVFLPRDDSNLLGGTDGVIAFVLDTETLGTAFRVTSEFSDSYIDVNGTTTACEAQWTFRDLNGDGHDDIRVEATCDETVVSDQGEDSRTRTTRQSRDCLWTARSDSWSCRPVAQWLFERPEGTPRGLFGESPEKLPAIPGLGAEVPDLLAKAKAEEAAYLGEEAAGEEPERDAGTGADASVDAAAEAAAVVAPVGPAAGAAPACVWVVDDPAPPLRVRAGPSSRAAAVGELPNGTRLQLVERQGRWARTDAPSAGWVWTENLREECAPTP